MQGGLTSTDRNLLWGAALIAVLLLAGTVAFSPSSSGPGSPVPSTYSSGSGGALAAYLLLVDSHYPVRRWEEAPAALPIPGRGSLLILAEPTEQPSRGDRESLAHFVETGGRILFCGISLPRFLRGAPVYPTDQDPAWKEFHPSLPNAVSRGAEKIVMQPAAYWDDLDASQLILYGEQDSSAVVAWRMGAGEILWWASATPLTNAGITRADNLRLFLNTVSVPENGGLGPIYWDEYFHGQRGTLWSYVQQTPVAWGCLQLGILALGLLFTFSRRSGPMVTPAVVSRLSPLEFVETMGGLYQRAGAASIPVAVSYRRLRSELKRRLGLATTIGDSELAQTARERLGLDDKLSDLLRDAALTANLKKLPARRALGLVRGLEAYILQLGAPRPIFGEKSGETKPEEKT
jgi:Domain of unknown function (DUF4350)